MTLVWAAIRGTFAATPQLPAPYEVFVRGDCELQSAYSAGTDTTTVQLALTPPGPDDSPSGASLILQARYAGTQPSGPPSDIAILALPVVHANPTLVRGVELELTIELAGARPVRLYYFGESFGDYGFVPPGGEIRRVSFRLSVAELRALLLAERVAGRVMNCDFVLADRHLAALRLFALRIGVPDPRDTSARRRGSAVRRMCPSLPGPGGTSDIRFRALGLPTIGVAPTRPPLPIGVSDRKKQP
jgi:hypothetical protein